MLEWALDAGVPASWVTADEVYGQDPALRGWLEGRGMAHVLAIKCSELLAVGDGPAKLSAAQLAAAAPAEGWVGARAGHGAKDDGWTTGPVSADPTKGDRGRLPAGQNEVGLDHDEVRNGQAGTGTSPWLCWPRSSWSSPAPRPPPATEQRGCGRLEQPARPTPAHPPRGPPTADCPGVDDTPPARLRLGLVTMAAPPPGPRSPRTLPTTRTATAAGVLTRQHLPGASRRDG